MKQTNQQTRIIRAAQIVSMDCQIERIDDAVYKVASQSNPNHYYEILSTEHDLEWTPEKENGFCTILHRL